MVTMLALEARRRQSCGLVRDRSGTSCLAAGATCRTILFLGQHMTQSHIDQVVVGDAVAQAAGHLHSQRWRAPIWRPSVNYWRPEPSQGSSSGVK